jgi:ribosomal protein L32
MVWLYVVIGLIIIIVMLVLINLDKRAKSSNHSDRYKHVRSNNLNICLSCGSKFRGHKCPYCGFDNVNINNDI